MHIHERLHDHSAWNNDSKSDGLNPGAGEERTVEGAIVSSQDLAGGSLDPYRALRFRDFRLLLTGALTAQLGQQMVSVAPGLGAIQSHRFRAGSWEAWDSRRSYRSSCYPCPQDKWQIGIAQKGAAGRPGGPALCSFALRYYRTVAALCT